MSAPGGVLRYRPCGACGSYVDMDGARCKHWRNAVTLPPNIHRDAAPLTGAERNRRYRARKKAGIPAKLGAPRLTEAERAERDRVNRARVAAALEARPQLPFLRLGPGGRPRGEQP